MEDILLTRPPSSSVPTRRPLNVASCSDAELYDALYHYCWVLAMLEGGGAAAARARADLAEVVSPLWVDAEGRGLPLHHLPFRLTAASGEEVSAV